MTENTNVLREMINGIYEIYISNLSNKMNKIMTILTIFSAIFIPLTFITGVYGMNFLHMPGLGYQYSFLIFWIVCVVIFLSMIVYFKNKRWL
jgi:magnesium transporter